MKKSSIILFSLTFICLVCFIILDQSTAIKEKPTDSQDIGMKYILEDTYTYEEGILPLTTEIDIPNHPAPLRYEIREETLQFSTSDGIIVQESDLKYPYFRDDSTCADFLNQHYAELLEPYYDQDIDYDAYYEDIAYSDQLHLLPYYDDVTIEIQYNMNGYISLLENKSFFTGGAHPYQDKTTFTIRLSDCKEMELYDFLSGEKSVIDQLLEHYYLEFVGRYSPDYGDNAPFVLTQDGICVFHSIGDAVELISFVIPYTEEDSCVISAQNALLRLTSPTESTPDDLAQDNTDVLELSTVLYQDSVENIATTLGLQTSSTDKYKKCVSGNGLFVGILADRSTQVGHQLLTNEYHQITDIENTGNMNVSFYGIMIGDRQGDVINSDMLMENVTDYDGGVNEEGDSVLTFYFGDAAILWATFHEGILSKYTYECRETPDLYTDFLEFYEE